jgi:hypothetical protein
MKISVNVIEAYGVSLFFIVLIFLFSFCDELRLITQKRIRWFGFVWLFVSYITTPIITRLSECGDIPFKYYSTCVLFCPLLISFLVIWLFNFRGQVIILSNNVVQVIPFKFLFRFASYYYISNKAFNFTYSGAGLISDVFKRLEFTVVFDESTINNFFLKLVETKEYSSKKRRRLEYEDYLRKNILKIFDQTISKEDLNYLVDRNLKDTEIRAKLKNIKDNFQALFMKKNGIKPIVSLFSFMRVTDNLDLEVSVKS